MKDEQVKIYIIKYKEVETNKVHEMECYLPSVVGENIEKLIDSPLYNDISVHREVF